MTDEMEQKAAISSAVLDVSGREITSVFSIDGAMDRVGDVTRVAAFRRTIAHRADRIPLLFMHDVSRPPIGKILAFKELSRADLGEHVRAEYPDATGGMACHSELLRTRSGDELLEGIKAGIRFGNSFGYRVLAASPHPTKRKPNGTPARVIDELRVEEISMTQPGMAAHLGTYVRLGKSLEEAIAEIKAGWRHGTHDDISRIRRIIADLHELIGDPDLTAEPASQFAARTSDLDALLSEVHTILEVSP